MKKPEVSYVLIYLFSGFYLVQASWWYLGIIGSVRPTMRELLTSDTEMTNCANMNFLSEAQRKLCGQERRLPRVISEGASLGISECKHQFGNRRWNCSTYNSTDVFGGILKKKIREKAYIYAISSAGIMYSITRSCAKGELDKCGCDMKVRRKDTQGQFEWGGCSENTKYGAKFSRQFVDTKESSKTASSLMNLWNNEAGRKAVKMKMDLVCKCHGVSGSCSIKICWQKMKEFRSIGAFLKEKFDGASMVKYNKPKNKLKRISKNMKKPTKKDLVYLEESPDFCDHHPKSGSLGTKGRQCIKDGYGLDGCNLMCCGRGYYTTIEDIREDCDCKFVWCCRVDCMTCTHKVEKHFCN